MLASCQIAYNHAVQGVPGFGGPFVYRDVKGYDSGFLVTDVILSLVRIGVYFLNLVLFCPDYFEYLVGPYDLIEAVRPAGFVLFRDTASMMGSFFNFFLLLFQTICSIWTENPVILGVNLG